MKRTIHILLYSFFLLMCPAILVARTQGFILQGNVRSVKIPVEIQNNIILIPIRINGSMEMNFILDTGVKTTILTEPLIASFLDLNQLERIRIRGLGEGEAINAVLARNISMSLPGVYGAGINMVVLPEGLISYSGMFGKPVYGIIGYELFGQFVVEINYHHKYIRLHDPMRYRYRGKGVEVPINIENAKPYVSAKLVFKDGKNIHARWLVDTGASQGLSMFSRELKPPVRSIDTFLGKGLSGNVYGKLGRVKGFEFGGFYMEDVIAGFPDSSSLSLLPSEISWYGNLGSSILSRFHVIFDYHGSRLILKKNAEFRTPFTYNISGIELIAQGKKFNEFHISYVRPKSPAAEADLRVNDRILSLNGLATESLDINAMYNGLDKSEGKSISMRIQRGDEVLKRKFKLKSEI